MGVKLHPCSVEGCGNRTPGKYCYQHNRALRDQVADGWEGGPEGLTMRELREQIARDKRGES